jgi:hypothetical protein
LNTIGTITGLNKKEAESFERAAIVAALFRLCDPLRTMDDKLNVGDTVPDLNMRP